MKEANIITCSIGLDNPIATKKKITDVNNAKNPPIKASIIEDNSDRNIATTSIFYLHMKLLDIINSYISFVGEPVKSLIPIHEGLDVVSCLV